MKDKATLLAGAALAVWILGGMTSALAQGPPPGGGGPGGGGRPPSGGPGGVRICDTKNSDEIIFLKSREKLLKISGNK